MVKKALNKPEAPSPLTIHRITTRLFSSSVVIPAQAGIQEGMVGMVKKALNKAEAP